MELLKGMAYMTEQPIIAFLPFLALLGLYFWSKRRFVLIAALLWSSYIPYEYGMKLRILCSGECNIRVDLLLIYPVLAVLSMIALAIGLRTILRKE
jgi:hypothetical protein